MEIKGIDVSAHQGSIDWATVANYGMGFAILRITAKHNYDDLQFENNYAGCKKYGIPVGVYKYSYALSVAEAEEEAQSVITKLAGRGIELPVWLDLEWSEQRALGSAKVEKIALAFLKKIKKAGYAVGIYCNMDYYNNVLTDKLKKYDLWLASYPSNDNGTLQERLRPSVGVAWQYSEKAKITGINGNVDRDVLYKDYTSTKKDDSTTDDTKDSTTETKEADTVSKLQEFIDLGNYYANNGGKKPYLEKKTEAYLDDFTKNAGSNNFTKFARDVNNWGQWGCQGQPWCAEFQFWKLVTVLGMTKALQIMGGGFYNCKSITSHSKSEGTWYSKPKKGALVIFRNGSHVGNVQSFDDNYIYTNEGNTSSVAGVEANGGSCRNKSYLRNDSAIDGYVWIDWDEQTETEEWKASGTATATVDDLYVRETPAGYVLGQINKGNRFEIDGKTSGNWTHVKVEGIGIGWIYTKYIKKDSDKSDNGTTKITNKQDKTERLFVGKVTANSLFVRSWAGTEYPKIKAYPILGKGNLVDVMNFTQTAKDGTKWYYVRIENKYYGFVSSKYIKKQ